MLPSITNSIISCIDNTAGDSVEYANNQIALWIPKGASQTQVKICTCHNMCNIGLFTLCCCGMMDWTDGLDSGTLLPDWTGELDCQTGLVDWAGGLDSGKLPAWTGGDWTTEVVNFWR